MGCGTSFHLSAVVVGKNAEETAILKMTKTPPHYIQKCLCWVKHLEPFNIIIKLYQDLVLWEV